LVVSGFGSSTGTYQVNLTRPAAFVAGETKLDSLLVLPPALDDGDWGDDDNTTHDVSPVLPALSQDFEVLTSKDSGGPEVLPGAYGDIAKDAGPLVLPGAEVASTLMADRVTAVDFDPRDGEIAATLSLFGGLPADDGYPFAASTDTGLPEVLPAMDDDFVLTAKFAEIPPVMPPLAGDFDGVGFVREMEFARGLLHSLGDQNTTNPYVSADGLTLFDEWSGILSPAKPDVWG
jgi:hypothetical protein